MNQVADTILRWLALRVSRGNSGSVPQDDEQFRWAVVKAQIATLCLLLSLRNRISKFPVTSDTNNMSISLTTYGPRIRTVFLTLESITLSRVRPGRVVVWVAEGDLESASSDASLRRLRKRGVEVKVCKDYGPHKKYFPWVAAAADDDSNSGLVTADDDVLYPDGWLEGFLVAKAASEDSVLCYRGSDVGDGRLTDAPYSTWPLAGPECTDGDLFPTGVSGVFYPSAVLRQCKAQGTAFEVLCPHADDIWLYATRLRTRAGAKLVDPRGAREWWPVPRAHRQGLFRTNVAGGGNDIALQRTLEWMTRVPE